MPTGGCCNGCVLIYFGNGRQERPTAAKA